MISAKKRLEVRIIVDGIVKENLTLGRENGDVLYRYRNENGKIQNGKKNFLKFKEEVRERCISKYEGKINIQYKTTRLS